MRLSSLFLLALGAAALVTIGWVLCRATSDTREWNELLSLAGKDLHKADEKAQARIRYLLSRRMPLEEKYLQAPWRLLVLEGPGSSRRVIVFQAAVLMSIPSSFDLTIDVLDGNRRHLSHLNASAGWRILATGTQGAPRKDLGPWTFEVTSRASINGADVARQIYALVDDQPVLLRLEDSAGKICRNYYEAPNHTIGPPVPVRTPEDWERALSSSDLREVLRTLVWLGGRHAPPTPPDPTLHRESLEEAKRFSETRHRPGVETRIADLVKSPHPWIADAATQARVPREQ
jgi:hypothetical protein